MGLLIQSRTSDSSWISTVWTCRSEDVATMTAVASETWGLVFWQEAGAAHAAVVGPESRTTTALVPSDASFVGIQFTVGTSLAMADMDSLVDGGIILPDVTSRSFWLDGRRWQTPDASESEQLVNRLVGHGALVRDPVVTEVLRGDRSPLCQRTVERRFRAATGLFRGAVAQIERVRSAARMLTRGAMVHDVVSRLGYYDEPHLARMLRRHVGRSAQQLRAGEGGAIALESTQTTTS